MNAAGSGDERDRIAEAYDSPPWWYDLRGFVILTFAYNSTLGHQLRFFGPHIRAAHLEAACGTGTLLELVLRWRRWHRLPPVRIVAFDYAEPMLVGARARFARQEQVRVEHADIGQLPYESESFDSASIANALHCLPDVGSGLREVFRVVKPGGVLTVNALLYPRGPWPLRPLADRINGWGMRKGILHAPFTVEAVRTHVEEAGFSVVSLTVSGNCADVVARRP